jgi:hypothetical protein
MRPLLLLLLAACAPAPSTSAVALSSAAPVVAGRPELRATLHAPSRATYDPSVLGSSGQLVTVRVENVGTDPVRVAPLRMKFTASLDGVPFRCSEDVTSSRPREPSWLAPGQSFVFERPLDCMLPLPGTYEIGVSIRVGEDSDTATMSFRLDVEPGFVAPRPVPARTGLFAIMTGGRTTRPMSGEAWARGAYQVVVAVINASAASRAVGTGRLTFLVYRKGSPLPCSGRVETIAFPEELAPGTMRVVRAPIACAPSSEGKYEVVGQLSLGESGESFEIGRIALRVTSDPKAFTPMPRSFGE